MQIFHRNGAESPTWRFDLAVRMCINEGKNCRIGKSDFSMAFRHVPLKIQEFPLMVLKAYHPVTDKVYFFIDKCLAFGILISCRHFQEISNVIAHIVTYRTKKPVFNFLNDFFMASMWKYWCDWQIRHFIKVCGEIRFPVSLEKTFWGTTLLVFLGYLLDTEKQIISIPEDKINKALEMIRYFTQYNHKKATVKQIQRICGLLNVLCKCIVPGRAFTRHLYALTRGKTLKPYHHVRVGAEYLHDLKLWELFLKHPSTFYRPFWIVRVSMQ